MPIDCKEEVTMTLALRYLAKFIKTASLSQSVEIGISKDVPAVFEYKIGDIGHLCFYLAPKMD